MKKITKILLPLLIVTLMLTACLSFAACGGDDQTTEAVFASLDEKYDVHMNKLGKAWITEHGKDEELISGSCKVREENSALTLSFGNEIVDVIDERLSVSFEYKNTELGINTSFRLHRGKMLAGLDTPGVVVNTGFADAYTPNDPNAPGGAGGGSGGMGATSLLMSGYGSGEGENGANCGKLEIKILKIQGAYNYTYTKAEGLKFCPTDSQKNTLGTMEVAGLENGVYTISYDLKVNLPPFASPKGSTTIVQADIESGLLLND